MNKFLLSLLVAGATVAGADARSLSPSEALKRAIGSDVPSRAMGGRLNTTPSLTLSDNGSPMVYVFESAGDTGYVIISADDIAAPMLGYSDNGKFDASNMPDNLRWWLGQYQGEIAQAVSAGVDTSYPTSSRAVKAPIAPMVTTKWDQDAPYNLKCPSDAGGKCMTGCVATAFAQVLKFHNLLAQGTGKHSYEWNNQMLSFDYGATTFQWDLMLDTYTPQATSNQTNAVATLMYACGVGVNMGYGSKESGASSVFVVPALIEYFNYDKGANLAMRNYCSSSEWDNMIYNELSTNGPVYYAGQSKSGGHAFVCDGYSNGYYHFNWGWSGMSDGYFLLNALDPMSQGIGGSSSGFNFDQQALFGVKKPQSSSEYAAPYVVCYDRLSVQALNGALYFMGGFWNMSSRPLNGKFVVDFVNASGATVKSVDITESKSLNISYGYDKFWIKTSDVPDGTTKAYLMYEADGKKYAVKIPYSQLGYANVTKSGNNVTVNVPDRVDVKLKELALESEVYINSMFKYSVTTPAMASGEVAVTAFPMLLRSENISTWCARGEDFNIELSSTENKITELSEWTVRTGNKLTIGDYFLCIAMVDGEKVSTNGETTEVYKIISPIVPVNLKSNLMAPSITINSWLIENPTAVDPYNVVAKVNVTGGFGYYTGTVGVYVFPQGQTTSVAYFESEPLFVSGGEKKEITITGNLTTFLGDVPVGGKYYAVLRDMVKNEWFGAKQVNFTIGQSGIDDIDDMGLTGVSVTPNPAMDYATLTAPEMITGLQMVSMAGIQVTPSVDIDGNVAVIEVSPLPAGIYLVRVFTVNGAYSAKVVKR